ncbi:FtsX-like permease family protein [candidate division KSB1 bacterium]|nr:FtsX-like permease family protein [candidate division KSB1 bacterium]
MSYWSDLIKEIFHYLRMYKGRTFMTLFGITWGTISIIVLLAFGVGLQKSMSKNMHGIGEGIAIMFPGRTGMAFEGYGRGRQMRFMDEDAELLRNNIPNIRAITAEYSRWGTMVRVADRKISPNITGVNVEYSTMRHVLPRPGGRFINQLDMEQKRRVAFIGDNLKEYLFKKEDAINKYIYIGDSPFLVIGVLKKKTQNSSYNSRDTDRVFIPSTTFKSIFGDRYANNIVYQLRDSRFNKETRDKVYQVLGNKYRFDPKDTQAINIWDTSEMDKFIFYFSLGFNIFMGLIGFMTLTVGGIGLANIMYVVVQERTREIGIRRSVGAKRSHIRAHFILEAMIIISIGAAMGFLLSMLLVKLIAMAPYEDFVGDPTISWGVAIVAISILGLIGLAAGYFPARRAANMVVIDSLRA